ncbi:MAG: hypothetical protein COU27_01010, partial [Candidatus Levybacteria bacterium CG10_big_fil_rev_8_21_14_0_10_36_7]
TERESGFGEKIFPKNENLTTRMELISAESAERVLSGRESEQSSLLDTELDDELEYKREREKTAQTEPPSSIHVELPDEGRVSYMPFDIRYEMNTLRKFGVSELEHLQGEEKKQALKEYYEKKRSAWEKIKEKYSAQKLGLADTLWRVSEIIRENEDTPEETLIREVRKEAVENNFTVKQLNAFERGISEFSKKRDTARRYRELYPDDKKLFEACFGFLPKGKVRVIKKAMTLHFRLTDEDYIEAYNWKNVVNGKKTVQKNNLLCSHRPLRFIQCITKNLQV